MTATFSLLQSEIITMKNCVVILAPFGQDSQMLAAMLATAAIEIRCVGSIQEFARSLPECAAGVLTTEALSPESLVFLQAEIHTQPVWSDTPLVLLTGAIDPASYNLLAQTLGNVTVLRRPLEAASLLTVVQAAIRARQKQYQVRELIGALEDSKRDLDLAINGAQLGTFYCDVPFDKIIWNDTCKDHFFLPHHTEVDFDLFYSRLHPDDREPTQQAIARCMENRVQYNVEYRVVAPDGRTRWINAIGKGYYTEAGEPYRFDGITIDITEKKIRERALQFLVALNDATHELNEPRAIMLAVARMLGEHLGVSRCAYAPMGEDQNHFRIYEDYTNGCASSAGEYELTAFGKRAASELRVGRTFVICNRDKETVPEDNLAAFKAIDIQAIICTSLIKNGKLVALMAVHQKEPREWTADEIDLVEMVSGRCWSTIERVEADKRLKDRTEEILALNARLKRSMTETHHRVKNNLQVVAAMIEMQAQEHQSDNAVPLEKYLQLKAHVHTLAIVHDLLTLSVKEDEDAQRVSAKAVLDQLLPMLQRMAWNQEVRYAVEDARISSKQCIALSLILNELVSNALKHGKKKAEVVFRTEGKSAALKVRDDGKGFAPDFHPLRAANMGLELVESLVRTDLKGKSLYTTHSDGGGEVTITFPLPLYED